MPRNNLLYHLSEWIEIVSKHMNHLSQPQAKILAMYSFGITMSSRSGRTSVAAVLADLLNENEENIESRLRDWYCDAQDKQGFSSRLGLGRAEVDIETCFEPWLRWILAHWESRLLPLAMDATTLRNRFTILSVSLIYRGNAIPVAWKILPGNQPHPWEPEWERLLDLLKPAVPADKLVLVLTDRGLYSPSLFKKIRALHWHPFMRIRRDGSFRPQGVRIYRPLASFAAHPGKCWCGQGTAFKHCESRLEATLLAFWEQDAEEPWLLLTDLPPEVAEPCWYTLRFWIEPSFRTIKRGALLWHNSKMTDPKRAARLWLPIALTMFWDMTVGTTCDDLKIASTDLPADLPPTGIPVAQTLEQQRPLPPKPKRRLSVFRRGWLHTLVTLASQRVLKFGKLVLGPLPSIIAIFDLPQPEG